jgi:hypothetical protein
VRLGIDWVSMAILLTAYVFSRIPGVNLRLGNAAVGVACGIIAYRYFERWQAARAVQFNLVMLGLAVALGLYYFGKAIAAGGSKRQAPKDDESE